MKQESFPSWLFANWSIVVDDPAVLSIATSPEKPTFFEIANETAFETGRSCNQKVIIGAIMSKSITCFLKVIIMFGNVITPDMHVEVEDAQQQKRSQSGGCQRVERLVDDQEPEEKYS